LASLSARVARLFLDKTYQKEKKYTK
jgi:hypothetical protein